MRKEASYLRRAEAGDILWDKKAKRRIFREQKAPVPKVKQTITQARKAARAKIREALERMGR
jgi:hypothetical protein